MTQPDNLRGARLSGLIPLGGFIETPYEGLRLTESGTIPHGWPPTAMKASQAFLHIFKGVR